VQNFLTFAGCDVLFLFVFSPADMAETRARMLGELAELGLVLARDLQQAAMVAEDAQAKVRLAEAFGPWAAASARASPCTPGWSGRRPAPTWRPKPGR
jgi:hypothetical protein